MLAADWFLGLLLGRETSAQSLETTKSKQTPFRYAH